MNVLLDHVRYWSRSSGCSTVVERTPRKQEVVGSVLGA